MRHLIIMTSFPPNGYGLYDMAGNVWEWCSDWYRHDTYRTRAIQGGVFDNPSAPQRITRGGSFLCNASYCAGYRPAARMKTSPDTSLSHTGFRCVKENEKTEEEHDERR